MWHASVSLQHPKRGKLDAAPICERAAIEALSGVGGPCEWWFWNPSVLVGHLRVPVTMEENRLIPEGMAIDDAGETGPQRERTL